MTDLYDRAAAVPLLLHGDRTPLRHSDPRQHSDPPRVGVPGAAVDRARRRRRIGRQFRSARLLGRAPADLLDRLRTALLTLPATSVLSHHTAAALYGFGVLRTGAVHVAVPAGATVPRRRGITAHECALPVDEVVEVCGLPCLPPARCAVDLARAAPRQDALAVLDAALRVGACSSEQLLAELGRHERLRGVRQVRELVPLATPLAECRQETHLRLLLHDARLPAPQPQLAVTDHWGVTRLHIDLGYEEQRVGVEYDGASHLDRVRVQRERHRHNWLAVAGWRLHYFTDADLYRRPDRLVQTVRTTLFRSRCAHRRGVG